MYLGIFLLLFGFFASKIASKPVNKSSIVIKNKGLLPHDHIPGVKLERDGHINAEFHHEAFLGRLVDKGQLALNNVDGSKKLIEVFHKVDLNNNHKVDQQELTDWIHKRIQEHYEHASKVNSEKFGEVDKDGDGTLSLKEYLKGLTEGDEVQDNVIDLNQSDEEIQGLMEDILPEHLSKWKKADINEDNKLNQHEFLAFHHPEHNEHSIKVMIDDLMQQMDDDGDLKLSMDEFVRVPPGEVVEPDQIAEDEKYIAERRSEFADMMDIDKDGLVTPEELTKYLDPRHKQHALKEANYLMAIADANHDGELTEKEMILHYELFTGSTMAGNPNILHDEF